MHNVQCITEMYWSHNVPITLMEWKDLERGYNRELGRWKSPSGSMGKGKSSKS